MARPTWLSITVELLGGRGNDLWPYPGRVFAVGPAHTFADLAAAINSGFGRWDLSHLSVFTLGDGRQVSDDETNRGAESSAFGSLAPAALDIAAARIADTVSSGDQFRFVFDLGDDWTHSCTVDDDRIDPRKVFRSVPRQPVALWGWGNLPDQYGRRWKSDDGASPLPARPVGRHPMLGNWPDDTSEVPVDLGELRRAVHSGDAQRILTAVRGHHVDEVLQTVGFALEVAMIGDPDAATPTAIAVVQRLRLRGDAGDAVLAEDLLAIVRGERTAGRPTPVRFGDLSELLASDEYGSGNYLDLVTGEVVPGILADPEEVGNDAAIDPDSEPDRWLHVEADDSRTGWNDMAAFAEQLSDRQLSERLTTLLQGKGAFRRFRDAVELEGAAAGWIAFAEDKRTGRARQYLADNGIRVIPSADGIHTGRADAH